MCFYTCVYYSSVCVCVCAHTLVCQEKRVQDEDHHSLIRVHVENADFIHSRGREIYH